jgi:hypothetical protein
VDDRREHTPPPAATAAHRRSRGDRRRAAPSAARRGAAERLRLHDLRPLSPEAPGEEAVQGVSGDMEIWSFRIPGAA